ncbi:DNA-binding transcriptional regulator, MarR family [Robiginitalea myxolifaciens]|uniref:DNA-binding transcriptional regulator, MarR family n=2 Tax=Robiginitalea myxolifaciens TaxID=400055 RepID=A0A1I6FYW7_9FLAO|nr:DNA-binding transcriptional regulator, MarR family [Robiginitalea myxolifaciens]
MGYPIPAHLIRIANLVPFNERDFVMKSSAFNPNMQEEDLASKITFGLERISEVFKTLLWAKAKVVGLSPIQIQIGLFVAYHRAELCNVSHLAKEFNVTKPTISDAVKILNKKGLIDKDYSASDQRSYTLQLTDSGRKLVREVGDFADPLRDLIGHKDEAELSRFFTTLSELIYSLNRTGVLTVQRTCFGCKFYDKESEEDYCKLLQKKLSNSDIRLDCPEFENRN